MYTLLIVEDENKTRAALKEFVPWAEWGIGTIAEAANGLKGLELAREMEPDLILTDIRMPEMDGLELAHRLQEELPDTGVIVLSAYSDLPYLKSAMKAGTVDYLLKPLDMNELEQAVRTAIRRKQAAEHVRKDRHVLHQHLPVLREQVFVALLENQYSPKAPLTDLCASLGLDIPDGLDWHTAVFRLPEEALPPLLSRPAPAVRQQISSVLQHAFRDCERSYMLAREREWIAVIGTAPGRGNRQRITEAAANARDALLEHFELSVIAYTGKTVRAIAELHRSIQELAPVSPDPLKEEEEKPSAPSERDALLVQAMKDHIAERYRDESFTVGDIASHLNYTSAYVCMVFKKTTGMTLNRYINLYRIRIAKRLMADPSLKMFEIATRSGYSNENYFAKVFKRYENMSPSDYRRGRE